MAKRWRIHAHDSGRIADLGGALGVPPVVAQLLLCRGISDCATARRFLNVKLADLREPATLPGAADAGRAVIEAVRRGERIVVYGDYDADGITGAAILVRCLRLLGANVGYYVPHRIDEGYGLNHDAIRKLAAAGVRLVITVDCGITSVEEAATARRHGIKLVVTDHHEPASLLPDAEVIVHPRLPGTCCEFHGLSGAGVAFKLAWMICQLAEETQKVSPRLKQFLVQALGLAALGTVADVVPLVDENRILVRHGLASLRDGPSIGLAELIRITKLNQKPYLDSEDIAFMLAPRINAAGRLGQAQLAVELLTTDSHDRATALAEYLHELNSSRDTLERRVYRAARQQCLEQLEKDDDAALVLAGRGWHAGVIGIVAGRLAEKFHRPVVMISLDEWGNKAGVGSARCVPGLNLHELVSACSHRLVSHGGHAAAAGLKIEESQVEAFRAEFCELAACQIRNEDRQAELMIDGEAPLSMLTLQTVQQMEQLAPFGASNPRPLLCTTDVSLAAPPQRMGGGGRHLSLSLAQNSVRMRAVSFGGGESADELANHGAPLEVAFRPVINVFRGRRTVELHLADWRPVTSRVST